MSFLVKYPDSGTTLQRPMIIVGKAFQTNNKLHDLEFNSILILDPKCQVTHPQVLNFFLV